MITVVSCIHWRLKAKKVIAEYQIIRSKVSIFDARISSSSYISAFQFDGTRQCLPQYFKGMIYQYGATIINLTYLD